MSVAASQQDEDARSHSHSNRHGNRHHSHAHHHHLHQHHHHGEQPPLSQHIDKPLRRHRWTAKKRAWTRTALDTERADFFDTRVTGRQEVWQILRAALEVLWEADLRRLHDNNNDGDVSIARDGDDDDVDDEDSDDDAANNRHKKGGHTAADESLATAQSILRAAEVTLPTGDLANGAYDPLGNYYALPEWIVSDPSNVAEDSGGAGAAARAADRKASERDGEASFDDDDDDGDDDEEAALRRREEKGKAVASVRNTVKVCARLSENGRDVVVRAGAEESVRSVARRVVEDSGVSLSLACVSSSQLYFCSNLSSSHPPFFFFGKTGNFFSFFYFSASRSTCN